MARLGIALYCTDVILSRQYILDSTEGCFSPLFLSSPWLFIEQPSFFAHFLLLSASVIATLCQIGFCITVCPSSFQLYDPKQIDRKEKDADPVEYWFSHFYGLQWNQTLQTLSINEFTLIIPSLVKITFSFPEKNRKKSCSKIRIDSLKYHSTDKLEQLPVA